jgi:UDP-N-acetylmuramoyl-L-alanyl-D-glutamate--2,6-diaminopimelate ligase
MFGCGGDRDRTKRPVMGEIAGRLSDHVILTSDNPRSENPLNIINDIRVGIERVTKRYEMEADRARAIHKALSEACEGDIVLLAGKGHETYQTIGGESLPFDDRQVARQVLRELGYGTPLD